MLKVNTQKISVLEFAKKYGLKRENLGASKAVLSLCDGVIAHFSIYDDGKVRDLPFSNDSFADILFDMIKNGDIIKEEGK